MPHHEHLSVRQQCHLLGLHRSNLYYEPRGESEYNLLLMKLMDEEVLRYPFKGVLNMVAYLKELGHRVNPKRVRRLLRLMGVEAIYPKRNLSKAHPTHRKYPYLLHGFDIHKPNQVWYSDITYIRLAQGFVYLVAIMDGYSRYVVSWNVSNSLDASFCVEALENALMLYEIPEILNSDQGAQYTSEGWTACLNAHGIRISMDGRGRAFDNIFMERLWRSVKYEEVYLHEYLSVKEAKLRLGTYFHFYNYARHHQALNYKKPGEIYFGKKIPANDPHQVGQMNHLTKVG